MFEKNNDSTIFAIVAVSSVIAFIVACIVCLVLTYFNVITRYYKNMFTHEGYLTLTLPVTNAQHILVKVTSGAVSIMASFIALILGFCIATAGEFTVEFFKALFYLIEKGQILLKGNLVPYLIELAVLIVVAEFSSILLYYACISIGQCTNKNRIITAIGVYFAYYFITQIISTVLIVIIEIVSFTGAFENIITFIYQNPYLCVHLFLIGSIIFTALLGLLYFAVSHFVLKKKLNLE